MGVASRRNSKVAAGLRLLLVMYVVLGVMQVTDVIILRLFSTHVLEFSG